MQDWVNWFYTLIRTAVDWLISIQLFGTPVLYIFIGIAILGVILRALLYKA